MPTLHLLNKSSASHDASIDCLRALQDGDALLLIEDGVYLTEQDFPVRRAITLYALQHDLHMRGLSPVRNRLQIVDDAGFVELCTLYDKTISWF